MADVSPLLVPLEAALAAVEGAGYRILSPADVTALRNAALEDAARAYEAHDTAKRDWLPGSLYDVINREGAARVRALKQPGDADA